MDRDLDATFAKLAVDLGMISKKKLSECLELQLKAEKLGLRESLAEIVVKRGYMEKEQANQIISQMGARGIRKIAHFELLELLGTGGMGSVYKARQVVTGEIVAVKILSPENSANQEFRARFLREAQAITQLHHENIVAGLEAGEEYGIQYFAMEFVQGRSLQKIIDEEGALPPYRALNYIVQIARALEHAHANDLIHRDIKPDNIIINTADVAKLTDLGLAKFTAARGYDAHVTQTGFIIGTPYYISPEQAKGQREVDIRTDIYSLGATFYHVLTGDPPFPGDSPAEVVSKQLTEKLLPPHKLNPEIPMPFSALICKMMAKNREQRYQNPTELLTDLDKLFIPQMRLPTDTVINEKARPVIPPEVPATDKRKRYLAIVVAVLVLMMAGLILWWWQSRSSLGSPLVQVLQRARTHRQAHPDKPLETLRLYQAVLAQPANEQLTHQVHQEISTLLKHLGTYLNQAIQESRYQETYTLFQQMRQVLQNSDYQKNLDEMVGWLEPLLEAHYQKEIVRAWQKARQGNFGQARAILEPFCKIRQAAMDRRAKEALAQIQHALKQEKAQLYQAVKQRHQAMIAARQYRRVAQELAKLVRVWGPLCPEEVMADLQSMELLVQFWDRFLLNLKEMQKRRMVLKLTNPEGIGSIMEIQKDGFFLLMSGQVVSAKYLYTTLAPEFIQKIYLTIPLEPQAKSHAALGLFFHAVGQVDKAARHYLQAQGYEDKIRYFTRYQPLGPDFQRQKAHRLLELGWRLVDFKNYGRAGDIFWRLLLQYRQFPIIQRARARMTEYLRSTGLSEIRIPLRYLSPSCFFGSWDKQAGHYLLGGPNVDEPLSIPKDYLDVEIFVQKGRPYRIWLKLKPVPNSDLRKYKVYVQFSESTDQQPPLRIGTNQALPFEVRTPARLLPFWYWVSGVPRFFSPSVIPLVTFPETGAVILRVQRGLGKVMLDEIVISAEKYLTTQPQ